jgi:HD-GYP domain-containing protein (c-di-GMP phosphodiesterase class II)
MDKQTHTKFNFNNFLMGLSGAFDQLKEKNRYGVSFNSQRVCYISLRLYSYIEYEAKALCDVAAYSMISFIDFQEDICRFPFLDSNKLEDEKLKQVIDMALAVENAIEERSNIILNKEEIVELIISSDHYDKELKEYFQNLASDMIFWLEMMDRLQLPNYIYNFLDDFTAEISYEDIIYLSRSINKIVYKHTQTKSDEGITKKCEVIGKKYRFENKDLSRLIIAANLQGLGKLFLPKTIFTKKEPLDKKELEMIKMIPYFSGSQLGHIYGFEDISKLCLYSSEKLDGSGYLYELDGSSLSLKDRVLIILVIYHALVEERPYRKQYTHQEAVNILKAEGYRGKLDISIIEDLEKLF